MTTILVVDDEPLIAVALEAALEDAGYAVVTAANGRQGWDYLVHLAGNGDPLSDTGGSESQMQQVRCNRRLA